MTTDLTTIVIFNSFPIINTFATLSVIPIICIAMMRRDRDRIISIYLCMFAGVLLLYSVVLWGQYLYFPDIMYGGKRAAWPLFNPNNAAAVINIGLICSLGLFHTKPTMIKGMALISFSMALMATHSRGGMIAALLAGSVYLCCTHKRLRYWIISAYAGAMSWIVWNLDNYYVGRGLGSMLDRVPIWKASWGMFKEHPFKGIGAGRFAPYYADVRTETRSTGMFAHNDLLQFGVEMGVFAPILVMAIVACIVLGTKKENLVPACAMLAVFIHTQISFHLYLPAINLLMAVLLAWWLGLYKSDKYLHA